MFRFYEGALPTPPCRHAARKKRHRTRDMRPDLGAQRLELNTLVAIT
jgi:hypothetical protein